MSEMSRQAAAPVAAVAVLHSHRHHSSTVSIHLHPLSVCALPGQLINSMRTLISELVYVLLQSLILSLVVAGAAQPAIYGLPPSPREIRYTPSLS